MLLTEKIYYVNDDILFIIKTDFELITEKDFYQLYQYKVNRTFWRLDQWDKYQMQVFVQLDTIDDWVNYNDEELRISLLLKTRGIASEKCIWQHCNNRVLNGLAYCEKHAYREMGIRK